MTAPRLIGTPQETWGNTILFAIAKELGYTPDENGALFVDPDSILEDALELIWIQKEREAK